MARFNVAMLGDAELERRLLELPEKVERTVITRALRNASQAFAKAIKPDVPRSTPKRSRKTKTGKHMADTLKTRAMRRRKHRIGYRVFTGTRAELGIPSGKEYYPAVIEFGSKTIAPRAFIRGPFRVQKTDLRTRIVNELREGLAKLG